MMKNGGKVRHIPKDAYETMTSINFLLKLFSLTTLCRKNKKLKIDYCWPKRILIISTITLGIILLTVLKVLDYLNKKSEHTRFKFTDTLQIIYMMSFVHYCVDLNYVFKFGGYISLKYFKLYEQFDEILGMTYYGIIESKVLFATVSVSTLIIVTSVLDFAAWSHFSGAPSHALASIDYFFLFVNTLTIIDMCANIIQVEYRLKTIGDILQDLYASTNNSLAVVNVVEDKNWLYYSKDKVTARKVMSSSQFLEFNHLNDIVWLNKCYLLLIEQTNYINEIFGARILLNNCIQLLNIVNFINLAIRIFTGLLLPNGRPKNLFFLTVTCNLRTICSSVNIGWLVYRCEQSYAQRESIISIADHILVDKNISESMRRTLSEFRDLVDSRPIEFTAMNFYPLNYGLVVSSASVITTLTTILLQSLQE